jgi:hypothetical protein
MLYRLVQCAPALGIRLAPKRGLCVETLQIKHRNPNLANRSEGVLHTFTKHRLQCRVDDRVQKLRMLIPVTRAHFRIIVEPDCQTDFSGLHLLPSQLTDAEVLKKEFGNVFEIQQFADLNRYEVLVNLLESGTNRTPFRGRTLEPLKHLVGRKRNLIARSRERFASQRMLVEGKLNRWINQDSPKIYIS